MAKKTRKFATQAEVDAEIDRLIALAIKAEERRDKQVWESAEYWKHHDVAIKWHLRAEALMPK